MVVTQENVAVNGSRKLSPQDIADALRDRIRSGALKPGDRLPTQAVLAEEFGVERGTVRQALKTLQGDGLLANVSKGSPPRVAAAPPPTTTAGVEPQASMVALAPRLAEAFSDPHVHIDVVSYTAETLMIALGEPVRLIHEGRIRPESISVRILLPSSDIDLAFPKPIEGEDKGGRVHQRWLTQRNAQGQVLRHNLRALRSSHGIDVEVTFRALPFTTPVKLYLLNGREALLAYYTVERSTLDVDSTEVEAYDAGGLASPLFSFEKGATQRDTAFVEESQKWFDALWATISTDLTLSW
ncbi:winged helix-turn-helix domain-containing protein [Streptomyces sp. NBC_01381]|uniref:winged helix-turn-helix domain-containing protein n=1 Tax=Streptomyces sp. NBC_01381 TaxID=2903845 RepID=UPI00224DC715|nr:winged helix-turn-helix domain-containing protein [Streptomyces sp. NBC_01381]MCX4666099.1 winged helix-turn-helix domain-containing protein [Streptomyces sp. NBC_01381]